MTTIAENIGNQYFQLSTLGVGALAVGIEDIRQCIDVILRTIPGTDPFRPLFGCNAYKYADKAITVAIPNIKSEIYQALSLWEPRIEVLTITHDFEQYAQLAFLITYKITDDDFIDSIVYMNGAVVGTNYNNTDAIIISALVPVKVTNGIYSVSFTLDGKSALPAIPVTGFTSASDMLVWITENWFNYGRWYLTANSLVLYLNSGIASKVFLSVTETAAINFKIEIPLLNAGEYYALNFTYNGLTPSPTFPLNEINTSEELLTWLTENWFNYGNWYITTDNTVSDGDFSSDFNSDFDIQNGSIKYLNYQSTDALSASLNFE